MRTLHIETNVVAYRFLFTYRGPLGVGKHRVVLHVDMDCFFVSVVVRNRPELAGKAVAVAHTGGTAPGKSGGTNSSSEISSCSYAAREKGMYSLALCILCCVHCAAEQRCMLLQHAAAELFVLVLCDAQLAHEHSCLKHTARV
jgi:nucleotidyltransferase/DNA polymerase involved in DNA repair